jgi:hypothetical protein
MQELKRQGNMRAIGISFRNGGPGDGMYPAGYGFEDMQEFAALAENVAAMTRGGLTDEVYVEAKRRLDAAGVVADEL